MPRVLEAERPSTPDDYAEAEAIAMGETLRLPERRHLVALFLELQRVRVENETRVTQLIAQAEAFADFVAHEGAQEGEAAGV